MKNFDSFSWFRISSNLIIQLIMEIIVLDEFRLITQNSLDKIINSKSLVNWRCAYSKNSRTEVSRMKNELSKITNNNVSHFPNSSKTNIFCCFF